MFSNITDAWSNDPVKEITNKLSNGDFQTSTDHENVFNFKKQNFMENKKKIKENDLISLSDDMSLSLVSDNTDIPKKSFMSDVADYTTYAPANYDKYIHKKQKPNKVTNHSSIESINLSDTDTSNILDTADDPRCTHNTKHLKKCNRCYYKLKKMVDNKINKKIDDIILDNKMKQLEAFSQTQQLQKSTTPTSDSWKETIFIVIGVVIGILIILLILKCIH